jgi:nucleotide-binding universal stress UspA family protein
MKMLVPTDFSAAADEALLRATRMGIPLGAHIDLVYVCEPASVPVLEGRTFGTSEAMSAHVAASLEQRVRRVRAAGLSADAKALHGSPPAEIIRHARRMGSDLIILGARGRSNGTRIGAVAEEVVRHSEQPVLVVPSPAPLLLAHAS